MWYFQIYKEDERLDFRPLFSLSGVSSVGFDGTNYYIFIIDNYSFLQVVIALSWLKRTVSTKMNLMFQ